MPGDRLSDGAVDGDTPRGDELAVIDESPWPRRYLGAVQVVLLVLGVVGAYLHAVPIHSNPTEDVPNIDYVDLAWLGLAALGALLPNVAEIDLGNFSVKLRKLRASNQEYAAVVLQLADRAQNWATSTAHYAKVMIDEDASSELRDTTYKTFVSDRLDEGAEILATSEQGDIRIMMWIFDEASDCLRFASGYAAGGLTPTRMTWKSGEGLIGRAFAEGRPYNVADVRKVVSYVSTRSHKPPYRAVYCEPLRWGREIIGMLTVDRTEVGKFDQVSIETIKGTGALLATAFSLYTTSSLNRRP